MLKREHKGKYGMFWFQPEVQKKNKTTTRFFERKDEEKMEERGIQLNVQIKESQNDVPKNTLVMTRFGTLAH